MTPPTHSTLDLQRIFQHIHALATAPTPWRVLATGESTQGLKIPFLGSPAVAAHDRLDALLFAGIHGDEVEGVELLLNWAHQVDTLGAIGIIPLLNPDGYLAHTRVNARGVDLNRNFPTENWTSVSEEAKYHPGQSPASEPETRFILDIIDTYPPLKILSLHTPYRVINYDGPAEKLAMGMAQENGYEVVTDIGYPTPGSFGTFTGIERNTPVITLELPEGEAYTPEEQRANLAALSRFIA